MERNHWVGSREGEPATTQSKDSYAESRKRTQNENIPLAFLALNRCASRMILLSICSISPVKR